MLKSGVPVLGAMAVVGDMMSNQAIGGAVSRLADGVKRGGTIATGMKEHTAIPALAERQRAALELVADGVVERYS